VADDALSKLLHFPSLKARIQAPYFARFQPFDPEELL